MDWDICTGGQAIIMAGNEEDSTTAWDHRFVQHLRGVTSVSAELAALATSAIHAEPRARSTREMSATERGWFAAPAGVRYWIERWTWSITTGQYFVPPRRL